MKVKIYGAGSAGCHLTHSCRFANMDVVVVDPDPAALDRMKNNIYPSRYGRWDNQIRLSENDLNHTYWDLVIVATPPKQHLNLATRTIYGQKTKANLIEKPLSLPNLAQILSFRQFIKNSKVKIFIGYNHTLTKNTQLISDFIFKKDFGKLKNINVFFKEHWQGIFAAHPWLKGPEESYLGNISLGGGATCEHSHGLNLFQYISNITNNGPISEISATSSMIKQESLDYDELTQINAVTRSGLSGHIQQDVITYPAIKKAMIQFEKGQIYWAANEPTGFDKTIFTLNGEKETYKIKKSRSEDFHGEINHIKNVLSDKISYQASPINIKYGINTMLVICAVFKSVSEQKTIRINYDTEELSKILT